MTVGVTVLVAAALAVVWVRVIRTLTEPASGPKTIGQPQGLVWDGRVFTSAAQLKAYLTAHGLSYSRWAARHPTAFGGEAPTVTKPVTTTSASEPATKPVAAPTVGETRSRPLASTLLTILLLLGGLVLAASAVIPPVYAPVSVARFYADPGRRTVALAAAAAILIGLWVSSYLT